MKEQKLIKKVEYRQTEFLIRAIVKIVIKSIENKWIRNKWGSTPYNVLGVWHTTSEFLIWRVLEHASMIARFFCPGPAYQKIRG